MPPDSSVILIRKLQESQSQAISIKMPIIRAGDIWTDAGRLN